MIYLAHRGFWKSQAEKNSPEAFRRAWGHGFGLETDLRDAGGEIVISHDIPGASPLMSLDDFLSDYSKNGANTWLALNIMADGLQALTQEALSRYGVTNYFVFDMSFPDMRHYVNGQFQVATRISEYEKTPFYEQESQHVWVDCFEHEWFNKAHLTRFLDLGKKITIVSPELHRRDHKPFWQTLKSWQLNEVSGVMLCTDFPMEAKAFFDEEN